MNPTERLVSALAAGRACQTFQLWLSRVKSNKIKSPSLFRDTEIVSKSTRLFSLDIKDSSGVGTRRAKLWTSGLVDSYVLQNY
jgi:hypothetical protein